MRGLRQDKCESVYSDPIHWKRGCRAMRKPENMRGLRQDKCESVYSDPISFIKTLNEMNALWTVLAVSQGLIDEDMIGKLIERVRESITRQATPDRRKRNCARKVRQPVSSWPRMITTESNEGDYKFELVDFT